MILLWRNAGNSIHIGKFRLCKSAEKNCSEAGSYYSCPASVRCIESPKRSIWKLPNIVREHYYSSALASCRGRKRKATVHRCAALSPQKGAHRKLCSRQSITIAFLCPWQSITIAPRSRVYARFPRSARGRAGLLSPPQAEAHLMPRRGLPPRSLTLSFG